MNRTKRLVASQAIVIFSFVLLIVLGVNYLSVPAASDTGGGTMHTYLVKIPNSAGVCPYVLMSRSNGRLKVVDNSKSICPYAGDATYMTTRCKDVNAVYALLPASLKDKVEIELIDNLKEEAYPNSRSRTT